jgi:hypothetical protein
MEVAMVTDGRVKELRRLLGMGRTLIDSARMAEMSENTARKYRDDGLPSQKKTARTYRTRTDPFADVWDEVQERLETEPKLKAKTLFEWLQITHEGRFPDSTRRTFERRVNKWRSLYGPPDEPRNHTDCIGNDCDAVLSGHFRSLLRIHSSHHSSVRPIRLLPRVRERRGLADMRLTGGVQ